MKKNKNKGFTLIELMIVVAIISILMAFAMPAYRDFMVKSKAGEGISMTGGLKTDIALIWNRTSNLAGVSSGSNGIGPANNYVGNNVGQISVNNGVIQVTYINDPVLVGQTLSLSPIVPGSAGNTGESIMWVCSSSLDNKYLPSTCQSP